MKKLIISEFVILLIGMLFAWTNFTLELISFLNKQVCTTGCYAGSTPINPVYTPCFYGALFFTLAFIISAVMLAKSKK